MNDFKAFRVHQIDGQVHGRIELINIDQLPLSDVLIKVTYSSVNYKDALAATAQSKIIRRFPLVAGIDAAGYVVSSKNNTFRQGDAVVITGYEFGTNHDGGYALYASVPEEWVIPLPDGISPQQAMSIGTAGFTVALCIHRLEQNAQRNDQAPFAVTGASGGVGSIAINILSNLGYQVVAISRKPNEQHKLLALGADSVLDMKDIKLISAMLETGQWSGAIDNVGGDILSWLIRTTLPWGNIVAVGLVAADHLHTNVMPFILRGVSLLGVSSAGCPTDLRRQLWQRLATDLAPTCLEQITQTVGLEDLPDIFAALLAGTHVGRTIVSITDEG